MMDTPEQRAKEAEQREKIDAENEAKLVEQGKRLVEKHLQPKGAAVGEWKGPHNGSYLVMVNGRRCLVDEEALGDSGGAGELTLELRESLDRWLRG